MKLKYDVQQTTVLELSLTGLFGETGCIQAL